MVTTLENLKPKGMNRPVHVTAEYDAWATARSYDEAMELLRQRDKEKEKIRPIVKAAFKVDELVYQFTNIDVSDRLLETGSMEEVNEKYDDDYIIGEARNRLDIAMDPWNQEEDYWQKDADQLRRFINKWSDDDTRKE